MPQDDLFSIFHVVVGGDLFSIFHIVVRGVTGDSESFSFMNCGHELVSSVTVGYHRADSITINMPWQIGGPFHGMMTLKPGFVLIPGFAKLMFSKFWSEAESRSWQTGV